MENNGTAGALGSIVKRMQKPLGIVGLIVYISVIMYYASADPEALQGKAYMYLFLLVIPSIIGSALIISAGNSEISYMSFGLVAVALMMFIGISYGYTHLSGIYLSAATYLVNIITILIVIVGLAILFFTTINNLEKQEGWTGFVIQFIFYIPCLFADFIQFMLAQYKLTPNIVFVLFIIEVLLIFLYFYLPTVMAKTFVQNGLLLVDTPMFLDSKSTVATASQIAIPSNTNTVVDYSSMNSSFRVNYAISMWLFVNPQSASSAAYSKDTEIMTYGINTFVKPSIFYNGTTNTYTFYFVQYPDDTPYDVNNPTMRYKLSMPMQRWNQVVFNYTRGGVDLFINGNLERSFPFSGVGILPTYMIQDTITVGSNKNGLDAAICNMVYHNVPLTKSQIANSYSILRFNNPPTLSIHR